MKIAILGWGSLVWDPRDLPCEGEWKKGGPVLPIEFSRVSSDCRLTLVIDPNGDPDNKPKEIPTRYALSKRKEIEDAICDLRAREGTIHKKIGFVITNSDESNCKVMLEAEERIRAWAGEYKFDAVIWTDLSPNFQKETNKGFTLVNAVDYLKKLPKSAKKEARNYIREAPPEVQTPLRKKLTEIGGLAEREE